MTVSTLRPASTAASDGVVTGAASAHAALSDDSDASYVTYTAGQFSTLGLTDLALPAGAILLSAVVRLRAAGSGWSVETVLNGIVGSERSTWVTWSTPTTVEMPPRMSNVTDALLDAASLYITRPGGLALNVYEAFVDARYVAVPVVTVSTPSGTVEDTRQPAVAWTVALDADGGGQTHFEAKIFTAAQYSAGGFDPDTSDAHDETGVSPIGLSRTTGLPNPWFPELLADGDYRAYVRVAQTVNGEQHWSDWDSSDFTMDVDVPNAPVLALEAENASGRVKLTLSDAASATSTQAYEVQRLDPAGWVAVRLPEDLEYSEGYVTADDPVDVFDYEAPNGSPTTYRARAIHDYSINRDSAAYAASEWTQAAVTWSSSQWWVKSPLYPALNVPVELFSYSEVNRAARQAVIQPLGATLPVVMDDTRSGATGTVVIQAYSPAEQAALNAILDTVGTLLLQGPVADGHPDRYVRFGAHGSARVVDKAFAQITRETLAWTLVAAPAGAQTGDQYAAPDADLEELIV